MPPDGAVTHEPCRRAQRSCRVSARPRPAKHGVRVRPTGPGAYTAITRDPFGKQRWTKVGSTAEIAIAEARDIARTVIRRVEQGLAPFEAPKLKGDSVAVVTAEWLKRHVEKAKLRSAAEYHRIVGKYILPTWGERAFEEIRRWWPRCPAGRSPISIPTRSCHLAARPLR